MQFIIRFLSLFVIFAITSSFSFTNNDKINKGNVIHSFKSGKMQCQSEIDTNGQIAVLLKSLTDNTRIEFKSLNGSKNKYLLKASMIVKADTDLCKGWIDVEPLTIAIDPMTVEMITLTGKSVFTSDHVKVVVSEN